MNNQNEKMQLISEIKTLTDALVNMALPQENLTKTEWDLAEKLQVLYARLHSL
jgi:hypothetical protein